MSDDSADADLPFSMISICSPDEFEDLDISAAILVQQFERLLPAAGYSIVHEDLILDDLASILPQAAGQPQVPMFILCHTGTPSGQRTANAWIAEEYSGTGPADDRQVVREVVSDILALAEITDLTVTTTRIDWPNDHDEWLSIFQQVSRCLLIIISPFDLQGPPPAAGRPAIGDEFWQSLAIQEERLLSKRHSSSHDAWIGDFPSRLLAERLDSCRAPAACARDAATGWAGYQGPPDVPMRAREGPLPHDGLFIRRNNAFGTKSTVGIADLIEQGVLIDQEQVRFDDFVASRSDGVPPPQAGEAVAVSHGSAAVPGGAKACQATTHFLEIALRAGDEPGDAPHGEPLPVNFVFVVDTSGSMQGDKLEIVKASLRQLYDQLRDTDILGVVTFDTQVRTVLKATRKAELPPDRLISIVYGLQAAGGTDLNLGVLYGINEIGRNAQERAGLVNCLYLFSDGDPTSGETNWIKIRSNIAARLRGDLTISCFGFGSDARIRELEALAGSSGGHFIFVSQPEDVQLSLGEDLTRREHLAAINIQLQIEIAPEVGIWHLYGHDLVTDPATRAAVMRDAGEARRRGEEQFSTRALPDLIAEENGIRIFAPDLAFGETYWIVFEVEVPDGAALNSLGHASVQYVDTVARDNRRRVLALTPVGEIPETTVAVHAIGLWTSEITFYALDDLYQYDRATAKERLSQHIKMLQSAHKMVPAPQFVDDQVTFAKLISLSENLDRPVNWDDSAIGSGGAARGYTMHTMNVFGQVRGGYNRASHGF
jgi:uncharacterized protein YegL